MTTLADSRRPGRVGHIRQSDDSLIKAGIHSGDLVLIDLTKEPEQDELCAAFTASGELSVRYFHRERNGDIRLTRWQGEKVKSFAPGAVIIFGCVQEIVKSAVTS